MMSSALHFSHHSAILDVQNNASYLTGPPVPKRVQMLLQLHRSSNPHRNTTNLMLRVRVENESSHHHNPTDDI
jgi:hypothetical protein